MPNENSKETYYVIQDIVNKRIFTFPVNENTFIDRKLLDWLASKQHVEEYDISSILQKGEAKLIDLAGNKFKNISNDLDTLARIQILSTKIQPGIDLSTLTSRELYNKISNIPDGEISEYLNGIKNTLTSSVQSTESMLVEIENFLTHFGVERNSAVTLTKYLSKNLNVHKVHELYNLSLEEITYALKATGVGISPEALKMEIDTFFSTLKK
jgi:hypothetical protein